MTASVLLNPSSLTLLPAEKENAVTRYSIPFDLPNAASSMAPHAEVPFGEIYRILEAGVAQERAVTLSAAQTRILLNTLDNLIQQDVAAFLQRMEDPALNEADERNFVDASGAYFWATDDPADSIYDDL